MWIALTDFDGKLVYLNTNHIVAMREHGRGTMVTHVMGADRGERKHRRHPQGAWAYGNHDPRLCAGALWRSGPRLGFSLDKPRLERDVSEIVRRAPRQLSARAYRAAVPAASSASRRLVVRARPMPPVSGSFSGAGRNVEAPGSNQNRSRDRYALDQAWQGGLNRPP